MNTKDRVVGHALAVFAVIVWGTTFISTKVLLKDFSPYEIIIFRIILAYIALFIARPRIFRFAGWKKELLYLGAGISGASLYQVLENLALDCAYASTISVIIASAPMFTALFGAIFLKEDKLTWRFFAGFILAMAGISLVSLKGNDIGFSLKGTLLALAAAALWGVYSVICRKINTKGDDTVLITRRTFLYAGLSMVPAYFIFNCNFDIGRFAAPVNLLNMLYLGIVASALCFLTWNITVRNIGVITSGMYIYVIPVVTVIFSVIILHEQMTWRICLGTVLVIGGLILGSEIGGKKNG